MPITDDKRETAKDFRARRDAIYSKVVRDMRKRTPKQVFATLIEAGIYTKDGRLTKHYRLG